MDRTLKGVTQLVGGNDVETRCAALLVLTRLGADEAAVVRCAARSDLPGRGPVRGRRR